MVVELVLQVPLLMLVMDSLIFNSRGQVLALFMHQALQVLLLSSSKVVELQVLLEHGLQRDLLVYQLVNQLV